MSHPRNVSSTRLAAVQPEYTSCTMPDRVHADAFYSSRSVPCVASCTLNPTRTGSLLVRNPVRYPLRHEGLGLYDPCFFLPMCLKPLFRLLPPPRPNTRLALRSSFRAAAAFLASSFPLTGLQLLFENVICTS